MIVLLTMDPGLWLHMVNVKPPYLLDLEIESIKKFILEYKRYSQKCPRQLLRSMQQFVLEFITSMIRIHQANSSRKRRLVNKTPRWKSLTSPFQPTRNILKTLNFGLISREYRIGSQRKKLLNVTLVV